MAIELDWSGLISVAASFASALAAAMSCVAAWKANGLAQATIQKAEQDALHAVQERFYVESARVRAMAAMAKEVASDIEKLSAFTIRNGMDRSRLLVEVQNLRATAEAAALKVDKAEEEIKGQGGSAQIMRAVLEIARCAPALEVLLERLKYFRDVNR